MKYPFSRIQRLTSSAQFKEVFNKGKKISTRVCAIFYCHNNLTYPRLGIVAPKKSIKKANERNFFKRTVREGFRIKQHKLNNIDIIFLAYKKDTNAGKEKLCQYLEPQWKKLMLE